MSLILSGFLGAVVLVCADEPRRILRRTYLKFSKFRIIKGVVARSYLKSDEKEFRARSAAASELGSPPSDRAGGRSVSLLLACARSLAQFLFSARFSIVMRSYRWWPLLVFVRLDVFCGVFSSSRRSVLLSPPKIVSLHQRVSAVRSVRPTFLVSASLIR